MRFGGVIWGIILILLGVLFLLNSLGILLVNVWAIFWPLALVLFGFWLLVNAVGGRQTAKTENLALQLKGFEEAEVAIRYGAGRLTVRGGAAPDELLSGVFTGGVEHRLGDTGERAKVELRSPPGNYLDGSTRDRAWTIDLNDDIPLDLKFDTGASEVLIDLSTTQTKSVSLKTGASSSDLLLPAAAGNMTVDIQGGAGSIVVRVPEGVAAQIEGGVGVGSLDVDRARFPRAGSVFQSADFEATTNRATIRVQFSAGEVSIR